MIRSTQETLYRLDNLNTQQERISYQMASGKNCNMVVMMRTCIQEKFI